MMASGAQTKNICLTELDEEDLLRKKSLVVGVPAIGKTHFFEETVANDRVHITNELSTEDVPADGLLVADVVHHAYHEQGAPVFETDLFESNLSPLSNLTSRGSPPSSLRLLPSSVPATPPNGFIDSTKRTRTDPPTSPPPATYSLPSPLAANSRGTAPTRNFARSSTISPRTLGARTSPPASLPVLSVR